MKKKRPDPDAPLTRKDWDSMGPVMHGIKGLPKEAQEAVRRSAGRPRSDNPKVSVTTRLDSDVLDALKAHGKGWQTLMNDVLKAWARRHMV